VATAEEDREFIASIVTQIETYLGYDQVVIDFKTGKERKAREPITSWRVETMRALQGILERERNWHSRTSGKET
jgi:hypothetical protein